MTHKLALSFVCVMFASSLSAQLSERGNDHVHLQRPALFFELNRGQAESDARFVSRGDGYMLLVKKDRTDIVFPPDPRSGRDYPRQMSIQLIGSNPNANPEVLDLLPGKSNYFIGKNSSNWLTGVPHYGRVGFESIYPGTNILFYGNTGSLEYDFIISPGHDPKRLRFRVVGADAVALDPNGDLDLKLSDRSIRLHQPIVYQKSGEGRPVDCGKLRSALGARSRF